MKPRDPRKACVRLSLEMCTVVGLVAQSWRWRANQGTLILAYNSECTGQARMPGLRS